MSASTYSFDQAMDFDIVQSVTSTQDHIPMVLGESVLRSFVGNDANKAPAIKQEYEALPLNAQIVNPELTPSVGTISPLEIHTSVLDSVLSTDFTDADNSPMFESPESEDPNNWVSLFADETTLATTPAVSRAPAASASPVVPSLKTTSGDEQQLTVKQFVEYPSAKDKLSPKSVEKKISFKKDHLGVVGYTRRQRSSPLAPIVVKDDDPVSMKRARNTEAARRSRAKKMKRMSQLEDKVEELLICKSELEAEVERLKSLVKHQ
ncbi:Transcriptional activator of amino acid biosynthetic genes [Komagataella phaffii]|uniref:Transcriptional activator n=1 Tax=Komagataella phaffii (strain GS115 / ATCC 20864) TaxID=644223 RepID=C4QY58_KOMPG|nr:Transcriptional activator [Komagataella phaffii GS115]AOA61509.1 GQ67_01831T0 [Komagataella phaffii]AOA66205.1 GQ68_01846T0 [Komagataella phaffii GS115]CAH2447001.1 Hypothetical protein BQ9382_C1-5910 [Komagataella phaffii CBS 7435]CAY68181.1 Transcriptional activator [Komagataella phaffii GS115]